MYSFIQQIFIKKLPHTSLPTPGTIAAATDESVSQGSWSSETKGTVKMNACITTVLASRKEKGPHGCRA
jgi:hypothetical protein